MREPSAGALALMAVDGACSTMALRSCHDGRGAEEAERWALKFGMSTGQINQMWQRGGDSEETRKQNWEAFVEFMSTNEEAS